MPYVQAFATLYLKEGSRTMVLSVGPEEDNDILDEPFLSPPFVSQGKYQSFLSV